MRHEFTHHQTNSILTYSPIVLLYHTHKSRSNALFRSLLPYSPPSLNFYIFFSLILVFHLKYLWFTSFSNYYSVSFSSSHSSSFPSLICLICVKSFDVSSFRFSMDLLPLCRCFQFIKLIYRPCLHCGCCSFGLCVCSPLDHPGFASGCALRRLPLFFLYFDIWISFHNDHFVVIVTRLIAMLLKSYPPCTVFDIYFSFSVSCSPPPSVSSA